MPKINLKISGIAAELALGHYMPTDSTIMNDWQEFYHYNDLIHTSQLLTDYIAEIELKQDDSVLYSGKIPVGNVHARNSFTPAMVHRALYLRTECAEQAVYQCEFDVDNFDLTKLVFETQDYDMLFKVGQSFLSGLLYDNQPLNLEWISGKPLGNICLLCRFENGFLVPVYDAVNKIEAK